MKIKFLSFGILSFGLIISAFIVVNGASAQTPPASGAAAPVIQYPVAELGNCANKSACRTYCDDTANSAACLSFAEKNNLMSKDEVQLAKNFEKSGKNGPGGCTTKDKCENYCNDTANIDECVAFAEQNNLMSKDQLTEAKQVQAAIKNGAKLPACTGKDACDKYCSDSAHVEECMAFAKAAGFMTPEEIQNSDKVIAAIKKGVKPPACKGSECDKYCGEPAHTEECIAFSEAAGMMTPQEAAISRKTGGKGPGGCTGKEQCDAFCNDTANQETCFSFGKDNGLISPDQLQKMEEGKKQFTSSLNQAPANVMDCISGVVGADSLEKFKNGTLMPPRNMGDKIGECFRQGMPPGGPGEGGNIPPGDQSNQQIQPWADMCKNNTALACADDAGNFVVSAKVGSNGEPVCPANSTAKCGNYDQNNRQEQGQGQDQRGQFQPGSGNTNPGGQMMPQQSGPGGCKTPEECQSFCTSNPDVCKNFKPSGGSQQGGQNQQNNRKEMMSGGQPGQEQPNQSNQQVQPWADMCKNNTALACVDGSGNFVVSAKVGSNGEPVCPANSTAKCGNYQMNNQQGQNQPNQQQTNQQQTNQNQPNSGGSGTNTGLGPCGTGPGTCSGIGPDDINSAGQFIQNQFNPLNQLNQPNQINQPGQFVQPDQSGQMQPQQTQQQFQSPPPPPVGGSLFESVKSIFGL